MRYEFSDGAGHVTGSALSRRALLRGAAWLSAGAALARAMPGQALAKGLASRGIEGHGIEGEWHAVTSLLDSYVDDHRLPGALAALGWDDTGASIVAPGIIAKGQRSLDDKTPPGPDTLYRLYSMTKPVTGMAAMLLIDEGRLGLDQPLADFVPEFAHMRVAVDPEKSLGSVPAKAQITIRQLLTHTAGLGYAGVGHDAVSKELMRLGVNPARVSRESLPDFAPPVPTPGPEEFLRRAASVPLLAEPGTKWRYSMGLDILGLVIERIAGKGLAAFLAERFFGPLGMESSFFTVPASAAARLTSNYGVKDGELKLIDPARTSIYLDPPPFAFGGSGLVASPADYDRFLRMIANGGTLGGRRVMSEKAVDLGTSNLLPAGVDITGGLEPGQGFGAGGRVGLGREAGYFGWAGAAGTVGFVDRRIGLTAGLYVQYMPNSAYKLAHDFPQAVRADLLARPPL